jgi:hypothetical protein
MTSKRRLKNTVSPSTDSAPTSVASFLTMEDNSLSGDVIDIFLCHNSADKPWVEHLAEQIESETFDGTDSGRPLKVFYDKWDIDIGQNFIQRINDGLQRARFVAVIISPEFLAAPWTSFEWTHVVAMDPMNVKARLIPIYRRELSLDGTKTCDLPAPFRALNWLDFRRDAEFKKTYQRLIRRLRGLPPSRGKTRRPLASASSQSHSTLLLGPPTSAAPDPVHDIILANLLPVLDLPRTVWSAPTSAREPKDVWSRIENSPAFVLREGRLFSFDDLAHPRSPFRKIISTDSISGLPVSSWRDDEVRWKWFVDLLHRALRNHLGSRGIKQARSHRYFFAGNKDGTTRTHRNAQDPSREVAAKKVNANNGTSFWVHHGCELRFVALGDRLFLCVEPCYVFTSDGRTPLTGPKVTPLSMKWGGKERNAAILRHVIFWARTLGQGRSRIEISTGASPIVLSGLPALSRTTFGIEFDHIALRTLIAQVDDDLATAAKAMEAFGAEHVRDAEVSFQEEDHDE